MILRLNKHDIVQIAGWKVKRVYVDVQLTAAGDVEYFVCVDTEDDEYSTDSYASYELARDAAEEITRQLKEENTDDV